MEKRKSSCSSGRDAGTGTQSHTHTLRLKNHMAMGHTKPLLWDLYHHVLALDISSKTLLGWLRYIQNGLKSLSLIAKLPKKPITPWTDTCWGPVVRQTLDSHLLVLCPSTAWEDGCLQGLLDFLGCLTHKAAAQDLSTCPSFYSKWTLAIFEKPSQAHSPIF